MWITFPFLGTASIFSQTTNDNAVLYAVTLNMFLAMIAGVLGTFTSCAIFFRKFSVCDLVFTGTAVIIFVMLREDLFTLLLLMLTSTLLHLSSLAISLVLSALLSIVNLIGLLIKMEF